MFKSFDFGKAMMRQIDAYRRSNSAAQQAKLPKLRKTLQTYAKNYIAVVLKPGKANPGQLTNGAEALLDAALALNEDEVAYPAFAELVARSKKVPVVPSLHTLVDRLLEMQTKMAEERASLLSWRITTGSLGPERFMQYLAERAGLSGNRSDWIDYAWGLDQLLKNGTLTYNDSMTTKHLNRLLKNKHKLGDRAVEIQLKMVDCYLERNDQQAAEELLIEVAADASQITDAYLDAVERLLQVKPGAEWGLHSMILTPLLADYSKGKVTWDEVLAKFSRAKQHSDSLTDYLLAHEQMPRDEKLSLHTLKLILNTKNKELLNRMVERWTRRHIEADAALPAEAVRLIEQANTPSAPIPEPPVVTELTPEISEEVEAEPAPEPEPPLTESASVAELEERLAALFEQDSGPQAAENIITELVAGEGEQWQINTAHRWLGLFFLGQNKPASAVAQFSQLSVDDDSELTELITAIAQAAGHNPASEILLLLGRLELSRGNYEAVLGFAENLAAERESQRQLLAALETWIVAQSEPPPQMLLALAHTQRLALNDPTAGFEPATTASLLARDDEKVQADYRRWLQALEPHEVHRQRAQQATYLCTGENRRELLPVAIDEIDALTAVCGEDLPPEPLEWLNHLRPLLAEYTSDEYAELHKQWTRLYLTYVANSGNEAAIPAAIQTAVEQVEPAVALSLADELGVPVPAEARLMVECENLARQGQWERAVELINEVETGAVGLLPVKLLCDHLPAETLMPTFQQLHQLYAERGDNDGQLELIRCMDQRLQSEVSNSDALAVRDLADEALLELCQAQYEPAVRYLLASGRQIGDPVEILRHMLIMARSGDTIALEGLHAALLQLLPQREPADLIVEVADVLAHSWQASQPAQAIEILARAGLATGRAMEMLARIDDLGLKADSTDHLPLVGQLALANDDERRALDIVSQLAAAGEYSEARSLAEKIVEAAPDSEKAKQQLVKLQFSGESVDLRQVTQSLLKLAQARQEKDQPLSDIVTELSNEISAALATAPDSAEGLYLNLVVASLTSDRDLATELIQRILELGSQAADGLLAMFEKLAMEDTGLPTALVVTWGRILFMAGKTADALDRLAGLRDAVGDYPEYTTLLKEIRDAGGGPGANMQLGEAYIRVNLWQRSAEEYAAALDQDPSLAIPILTQLRHHGALDPNPMQYPLHLLALRCVTESERQADWGWALSALTWLLPRWSAEELYHLATDLWRNAGKGELTDRQRSELLLHLFKLAIKLGQAEEALAHLHQAWQLVEEPSEELLEALDDIDESKLPADSPQWIELRGLELAAAVLRDDPLSVIEAAQKLAATGPNGCEQALQVLSDYQTSAEDAGLVLLARLQLLDLSTTEGRQVFVDELLAAAETDLPPGEVHSLISTVLELIKETTDSPELTQLLLQLFLQLGDEARAWQLALSFIDSSDELSAIAIDILQLLADGEYALPQQITLTEVHLLRAEYEQAFAVLDGLEKSQLEDLGRDAARLAEAMLFTGVGPQAREWLVEYYRLIGDESLAADHTVWALASGQQLPTDWVHQKASGDMLFRSGQLRELEGDLDAAKHQYLQGCKDGAADEYIRAAMRVRLAQLAENDGDLEQAQQHIGIALEILPASELLKQRAKHLATALSFKRIEELRSSADSVENRVEIARLLCAVGKPAEAINELQNGISRGQANPEISVELGDCFILQGDYRIALRVLSDTAKRLEDSPDKTDLRLRALYSMSTAHEFLREPDDSIRCLEQILVLKQDYRDSRAKLEELYANKNRSSRAPREPAAETADSKRDEIVSEILGMLGVSDEANDEGSES